MDQIWYDNISGMFTYSNYYLILPMENMTIQEKLNAIVRFFLYLGVLLALIRADYRYLFLGIIAAVVSVLVNEYEVKKQTVAEKFLEKKNLDIIDNKVCARSTEDNPFMNMSIADIKYNPDHPEACSLDNKKVKKTVDKNFNSSLIRDVSDLYGKYASQRQFYTMPVTTITNDQSAFGRWLYGDSDSCKQGNGEQCFRNIV
jgi:hypothetical protein